MKVGMKLITKSDPENTEKHFGTHKYAFLKGSESC
jgi:hypothetical protein